MGKRVAIISGVVTLAVICAGLLWSREFAVRYQVYRMRRDADYLLGAIESPEGTIAGEAVRRTCASGQFPGTGLLRAYVEGLAGRDHDFESRLNSGYHEAHFSIGDGGDLRMYGRWKGSLTIRSGGTQIGPSLEGPVPEVSRLVAIQAFLAKVRFTCSDFPAFPGAVFSFHPAGQAFPEESLLTGREPPDRPYCVVRWPEKAPGDPSRPAGERPRG